MRRRRRNPWIGLGVSAFRLGLEASSVINLRLLKIAAGGPAGRAETGRMVREKIEAGLVLQTRALTGQLGVSPAAASARTVAFFRRKVRANQRRLSRGKSGPAKQG